MDRLDEVWAALDEDLWVGFLAPVVLLDMKIRGMCGRAHRAIENDATLGEVLEEEAKGLGSGLNGSLVRESSVMQQWLRVGACDRVILSAA
ncbi:MAG: hypothetical protein Q8Q09_10890 [Deltaproteobacteria bacterium]|nr:hypothetical protein [Deltaproteobacteria bacterium]